MSCSHKNYNSFLWIGSTISRLDSHYKMTVYFVAISSAVVLVIIWSTSGRWKAESTLEPRSSYKAKTLGLGIHRPTYTAFFIFNLFTQAKFCSCFYQDFKNTSCFWNLKQIRNFSKLTRKHLYQSHFLNKVAHRRHVTLHVFCIAPTKRCFWNLKRTSNKFDANLKQK